MFSGKARAGENVQIKAAALLITEGALVELSAADAREVVSYMRPERIKAGEVVIREGESTRNDFMALVLDGEVTVENSVAAAHDSMVVSILGPGGLIGDMGIIDGGPRSASVEAAEATVCALISREDLLAYIAEQPAFALELMARLIRRARLATDNARSMALVDVYGRLTRLLDQLAEPPDADGARTLRERLTHQQIASHLACSREMVSRLLKDLENGGYVAQRERRLVLLKTLPARW